MFSRIRSLFLRPRAAAAQGTHKSTKEVARQLKVCPNGLPGSRRPAVCSNHGGMEDDHIHKQELYLGKNEMLLL